MAGSSSSRETKQQSAVTRTELFRRLDLPEENIVLRLGKPPSFELKDSPVLDLPPTDLFYLFLCLNETEVATILSNTTLDQVTQQQHIKLITLVLRAIFPIINPNFFDSDEYKDAWNKSDEKRHYFGNAYVGADRLSILFRLNYYMNHRSRVPNPLSSIISNSRHIEKIISLYIFLRGCRDNADELREFLSKQDDKKLRALINDQPILKAALSYLNSFERKEESSRSYQLVDKLTPIHLFLIIDNNINILILILRTIPDEKKDAFLLQCSIDQLDRIINNNTDNLHNLIQLYQNKHRLFEQLGVDRFISILSKISLAQPLDCSYILSALLLSEEECDQVKAGIEEAQKKQTEAKAEKERVGAELNNVKEDRMKKEERLDGIRRWGFFAGVSAGGLIGYKIGSAIAISSATVIHPILLMGVYTACGGILGGTLIFLFFLHINDKCCSSTLQKLREEESRLAIRYDSFRV